MPAVAPRRELWGDRVHGLVDAILGELVGDDPFTDADPVVGEQLLVAWEEVRRRRRTRHHLEAPGVAADEGGPIVASQRDSRR